MTVNDYAIAGSRGGRNLEGLHKEPNYHSNSKVGGRGPVSRDIHNPLFGVIHNNKEHRNHLVYIMG